MGPTKEGTLAPIFEERLLQVGGWLRVNGEAIYGSKPWPVAQNESAGDVWYTSRGDSLYAISLGWPEDEALKLEAPRGTKNTKATILGLSNQ